MMDVCRGRLSFGVTGTGRLFLRTILSVESPDGTVIAGPGELGVVVQPVKLVPQSR